eukprot:13822399-Alexandrium_andersonii.AAC.1
MVVASRSRLRTGPRSSRGAHSALLFVLSANTATRAFPELVWGSSWMTLRAERGGESHDGGTEQSV